MAKRENKGRKEGKRIARELLEKHKSDPSFRREDVLKELPKKVKHLVGEAVNTYYEAILDDAINDWVREADEKEPLLPFMVPLSGGYRLGDGELVSKERLTRQQGKKVREFKIQNITNAERSLEKYEEMTNRLDPYWVGDVGLKEAYELYLRDHPEERPGEAS